MISEMKFEMQDFQVNHLAFLYLEFHSEVFALVENHIVFFFEKDGKHICNKSLETKLLLLLQISDISGRFWSSLVKDTIFCFTTSQNRTAQRNDE